VHAVQARYDLSFEPLILLPQETIDFVETRAAQTSGDAQPDFAGMMVVTGPDELLQEAAQALLDLEDTEWVQFVKAFNDPTCSDVSPVTPNYFPPPSPYLNPQAPDPGLNMTCAWTYNGKGNQIKIADLEGGFTVDHEDLCNVYYDPAYTSAECLSYVTAFPAHGAAVLGQLGALENSYGCTGLVPQSSLRFFPDQGSTDPYCPNYGGQAGATLAATADLAAGDVILFERGARPAGTSADGPAELDQALFGLITCATSSNIIVVEAAANGNVNLDGPEDAYVAWRSWGDDVRLWFRAEAGTSVGQDSIAEFDNYKVDGVVIDSFTGSNGSAPNPSIWTSSASSTDNGSSTIQTNRLRVRSNRFVAGDPAATRWLKHNTSYDIDPATPKIFEVDFFSASGAANRNASLQIVPATCPDTCVSRDGDARSVAVVASDDAALAGIWIGGTRVSNETPVGTTVKIQVGADVKVFYNGVQKGTGLIELVDSGAIIVGGGKADADTDGVGLLDTGHERCAPGSYGQPCPAQQPPTGEILSTYGTRVDVQGWGEAVFTLGFGSYSNLPTTRGSYTQRFSGTSSAAAMVAGAVASLQSIRVANGLSRLTPSQMRQLLIDTGIPQGTAIPGHIGPFPNLAKAILSPTMGLMGTKVWDCNGNNVPDGCEGGRACCLTEAGPCQVITQSCCQALGGFFFPQYTKCKAGTCQSIE
jgi:hypothetical protein